MILTDPWALWALALVGLVAIATWFDRSRRGVAVASEKLIYDNPLGRFVAEIPFGLLLADDIKVQRYVTLQASGDEGLGHGVREYMKSGFITDVSDDLVNAIVENRNTSPTAWFFIMPTGGAINDVGLTDTAFPVRNSIGNMMTGGVSADAAQDQAAIQSTRAYWKHLEPHTHGYYINLNEDVTEKKTRSNFGPNLARLTEIKNSYDPNNLFRLNANVRPTV